MTVFAATGTTSVQLSTGRSVPHNVYTHIIAKVQQASPEVLSRLFRAVHYDLKKNPHLMTVRSSILKEARMTVVRNERVEEGRIIRAQDTKIPEGQIIQVLKDVLRADSSGAISIVNTTKV